MQKPIDGLRQKWREQASLLKAASRYRTPFLVSRRSPLLDFSSSDYLGLRSDPRLAQAGMRSVELAGGSGSGASRAVLQCDETLTELESFFADWVGFPSALYCGSGFVANCALFDALSDTFSSEHGAANGMEIFLDHRAHASLYAATKLANLSTTFFKHSDSFSLRKKLSLSEASAKVVVVESLHSMDGTFENAFELAQICSEFNAVIVVDEAHTCGIEGAAGSGWLGRFPELKKHTLAVMYGCGKAVGVSGGIIAGPVELKERIFQKSKPFLYTTGVSPFLSGAVLKACQILASEEGNEKRRNLQDNIKLFSSLLGDLLSQNPSATLKFQPENANLGSPIFSVPMESDEAAVKAAEFLVGRDFLIRAMRPPTVPRNTSRLRIILKSNHSSESLHELAGLICKGFSK